MKWGYGWDYVLQCVMSKRILRQGLKNRERKMCENLKVWFWRNGWDVDNILFLY